MCAQPHLMRPCTIAVIISGCMNIAGKIQNWNQTDKKYNSCKYRYSLLIYLDFFIDPFFHFISFDNTQHTTPQTLSAPLPTAYPV